MDIVIFGITGDLSHKKILPALERLLEKKALPDKSRIIGFSRSKKDIGTSIEYLHVQGSYDNPKDFLRLKELLRADKPQLFYFALPPAAYRSVLGCLHEVELVSNDDPAGFRLILIEKPFGLGYEDAQQLISFIKEHFRNDQCLKIDHYAGKNELRNLEEYDLSRVKEITFAIEESSLVDGRKGYYDSVGALRDVGQNHLLFMLATFLKGEGKREDVLKHLTVDTSKKPSLTFGMYEGYDQIETYFSIQALVSTKELMHIPLRLLSGKGFKESKAHITIVYKDKTTEEIVLGSGTGAYEYVFMDALAGKSMSFITDEEVLLGWKFIERIELLKPSSPFISYAVGSTSEEIKVL